MSNALDLFQDKLPYDTCRYHPRPGWNPRVFQARLQMLAGKNPHGEPRLRIMWGPDITKFWGGRYVPKYIVARGVIRSEKQVGSIISVSEEPIYWGYPHWFVEQWRAPEQMTQRGINPEQDWQTPIINRDRLGAVLEINLPDNLDTTRKVEDQIGEFPRAGRYDYFYRVNPAFREPTSMDFQEVQKRWKEAVALMQKDPELIEAEAESARQSAADARKEKYADAYGRDLRQNLEVLSRGAAGRKATVILPHDRPDQESTSE